MRTTRPEQKGTSRCHYNGSVLSIRAYFVPPDAGGYGDFPFNCSAVAFCIALRHLTVTTTWSWKCFESSFEISPSGAIAQRPPSGQSSLFIEPAHHHPIEGIGLVDVAEVVGVWDLLVSGTRY